MDGLCNYQLLKGRSEYIPKYTSVFLKKIHMYVNFESRYIVIIYLMLSENKLQALWIADLISELD